MRRPIPTDCRAEAAFQDIARASGLGICPWLSLLGKSGGPGKRSQISRGQKMSWALSLVATSQPHIDRVSLDLSSWAWPLPPTPASHIPCPLHGATCCFLACALNITPPCLCLCLQPRMPGPLHSIKAWFKCHTVLFPPAESLTSIPMSPASSSHTHILVVLD